MEQFMSEYKSVAAVIEWALEKGSVKQFLRFMSEAMPLLIEAPRTEYREHAANWMERFLKLMKERKYQDKDDLSFAIEYYAAALLSQPLREKIEFATRKLYEISSFWTPNKDSPKEDYSEVYRTAKSNLGVAYIKLAKYAGGIVSEVSPHLKDAVEALIEALKYFQPEDEHYNIVRLNLAEAYAKLSRFEDVEKNAGEAIDICYAIAPDSKDSIQEKMILGIAHLNKKEFKRAENAFSGAIRMLQENPNDEILAEVQEYMGDLFAVQNQHGNAVTWWKQARGRYTEMGCLEFAAQLEQKIANTKLE
jgi:tetratricopeptide (TPR) repeat protein